MQAVNAILEISKAPPPTHDNLKNSESWDGVRELAIQHFFATYSNINQFAAASLTEDNLEEIKTIYEEWQTYFAQQQTDRPEDAQESIAHLFSIIPEKHVIPSNKLANTITQDMVNTGENLLKVSSPGAKKLIKTSCILTYEGKDVELTGRQAFTEYDRNVYNAVTSLYVHGDPQHNFTPAMVYRAMTGRTDNEKPTENQLKAIIESLDKMSFIKASIDCSEELKMRRAALDGRQISKGKIGTYLLAAKTIELEAGGNVVNGYHLIEPPVLYEYAAAVKQVITVPIKMLDVKKLDKNGKPLTHSLKYTPQRVLIKGYLIRRIEGMKGQNSLKNPKIRFLSYEKDGELHEGLYSIAGADNPTKKEAFSIREDAAAMLSYWKAEGYIKGYEPYKEGRNIAGYTIVV